MRSKNVFRAADAEFAVLEPNGELNALLKKEYQPVTLHDLHVNAPDEKEPQVVIMDRKVLNKGLARWVLAAIG